MYHLTAIGNAIVDIIIKITEEDFQQLEYVKGTMNLVSTEEQNRLLSKFSANDLHKISGGAAANSLVLASQLGVKSALIACYSDDHYGSHYSSDFQKLGIDLALPPVPNQQTATSVILVTPDGERTMQTCLGVSAEINPSHINDELISKSEIVLIEGYLLTSDTGWATVQKAVALAKASNVKIASTLSAPFIIEFFRERLDFLVNNSSLCFANAKEAELYTGFQDPELALQTMNKVVPHMIVTLNKDGALVGNNSEISKVKTLAVKALDSTGAGDAFCGAYLAQYQKGYPPEIAADLACKLAGEVVKQYGARLDTKIVENHATI
jgi:sugar/nucleoside kinase (ribokinase family)